MKRKTRKFVNAIIKLCEEHGMSISHQDFHGAFVIENYDKCNITWFKDAKDETK